MHHAFLRISPQKEAKNTLTNAGIEAVSTESNRLVVALRGVIGSNIKNAGSRVLGNLLNLLQIGWMFDENECADREVNEYEEP